MRRHCPNSHAKLPWAWTRCFANGSAAGQRRSISFPCRGNGLPGFAFAPCSPAARFALSSLPH
jgi:hypothetical protein